MGAIVVVVCCGARGSTGLGSLACGRLVVSEIGRSVPRRNHDPEYPFWLKASRKKVNTKIENFISTSFPFKFPKKTVFHSRIEKIFQYPQRS